MVYRIIIGGCWYGRWFVGGDDLTGALRVISPVVTNTSIVLSSNKIQNGDILVPANPGAPGEWPLKRIEVCELLVCCSGYGCH